jgi:SAM-dependent methyltransferase
MDISQIPIIVVSYNSPDLIETLLSSIRQFYSNKVYIIDGSAPDIRDDIDAVTRKYVNVDFIPFGYNIHHGPGMAWAIQNLPIAGPTLFLDSDVEIIHPGAIESLYTKLEAGMYGVGWINFPTLPETGALPGTIGYLSPLCMLCNVEVMRQWPLPIKHGAPMITPMTALARANRPELLGHVEWIANDCTHESIKQYIRHDWQGTVRRTSGYHYDTQEAGSDYNHDVLPLIPPQAYHIVEVGCGNGALARAYKRANPLCHYVGIENDQTTIPIARTPCDFVFEQDIETADATFFQNLAHAECWIFSNVLEYLNDPVRVLQQVRKVIATTGNLIVSVPNAQYWAMQSDLAKGVLAYSSTGIQVLAHRRRFTRTTLLELLATSGFQVTAGVARMAESPSGNQMQGIRILAESAGGNPDTAMQDALPVQYVVSAKPVS